MTVTQRPAPPRVFLSSSQRPRRGGRAVLVLILVGVVIALLAAGLGAFWLAERDTLPARTVIAGVQVGGKSTAEARRLVLRGSRTLEQRRIEVRLPGDTVTVTGSQLDARPRVAEAIKAADGTSLLRRAARRLGFGKTRAVTLRFDLDKQRLQALGDELDGRIAVEPRDAVLHIGAAGTRVAPAAEGRAVARRALVSRLRALPASLAVPINVVTPRVTTAAAEQAQMTVDRLLAEPRIVALHTSKKTLTPQALRKAIQLEPANGSLAVRLDAEFLRRWIGKAFGEIERPARDASFRVVGASVRIVPSRPGKELDVDRVAHSLVDNLTSRVHRARFRAVAPLLTTEEAEALDIHERVSEFTTYYPCCAPRVTNIQRAAELLDGTVLRPGETFSLNEALGKRTTENGFVTAPQIFAGRLEDAIGGGISQVATTLYNAAFFAGLRLDAHQAHQFYISRYPMGREATVSWGGPELIFTNDWKSGLLIKVSASDSAIAVRFFSSQLDRKVETATGQPYAYKQPTTRTTKNPALKPGEKLVLQDAGGPGFTVEYTRKVFRGPKLVRDEKFRVRYDPQNGYVEIGPKKKKPKPKPKPPGAGSGLPGPAQPGDTSGGTPPAESPATTTPSAPSS